MPLRQPPTSAPSIFHSSPLWLCSATTSARRSGHWRSCVPSTADDEAAGKPHSRRPRSPSPHRRLPAMARSSSRAPLSPATSRARIFRFSNPVPDRHSLLAAIRLNANNHQKALLVAVFATQPGINTVRPPIDISFDREVTLVPGFFLVSPLRFQSAQPRAPIGPSHLRRATLAGPRSYRRSIFPSDKATVTPTIRGAFAAHKAAPVAS